MYLQLERRFIRPGDTLGLAGYPVVAACEKTPPGWAIRLRSGEEAPVDREYLPIVAQSRPHPDRWHLSWAADPVTVGGRIGVVWTRGDGEEYTSWEAARERATAIVRTQRKLGWVGFTNDLKRVDPLLGFPGLCPSGTALETLSPGQSWSYHVPAR